MDTDGTKGCPDTDTRIKDNASESDGLSEFGRLPHRTLIFTSKHHLHSSNLNPQKMESMECMDTDPYKYSSWESSVSFGSESSPTGDTSFNKTFDSFGFATLDDECVDRSVGGHVDTLENSSSDLSNSLLNTAFSSPMSDSEFSEIDQCSCLNTTFEVDSCMQRRSRLSVIFEEDSLDLISNEDNEDV